MPPTLVDSDCCLNPADKTLPQYLTRFLKNGLLHLGPVPQYPIITSPGLGLISSLKFSASQNVLIRPYSVHPAMILLSERVRQKEPKTEKNFNTAWFCSHLFLRNRARHWSNILSAGLKQQRESMRIDESSNPHSSVFDRQLSCTLDSRALPSTLNTFKNFNESW